MNKIIQIPIKCINDNNMLEVTFRKEVKTDGEVLWKTEGEKEPVIEVVQHLINGNSVFSVLGKTGSVESTDDEIINSISECILQSTINREIDESDGIEHEEIQEERVKHVVDNDPYDPKLIRVEPKVFSIQYVCELIDSGDIDLSPDFQREFVWSDITRKSRLIESLLLRIPIPVFYLVQDENGRFQVVDGVQRLTVINDYVNNRFRLKNLEYLKECEGKYFNNKTNAIDPLYVKRIAQTQLTFNIIDPQTPEQVRYDIFRRINTGGKSLNNQEIRNCLEKPHVRQLLRKLSGLESFKKATRGSIKSTRMADRELALRFVAFYLQDHKLYGQDVYRGDMDQYLDNTVNLLNKSDDSYYDTIINAFDKAMKNASIMFGDRAFRKSSLINKALFLSWSRVLCDIEETSLRNNGKDYTAILSNQINKNAEYNQSLSLSTNDVRRIEYNYNMAKKIVSGDQI